MKNPDRVAAKRRAEAHGDNDADTIVVYSTSNGATMQYASWIANSLQADIIPFDKKTLGYVTLYDNVIFGGFVKAGEISKLTYIWANYDNFGLYGKNLIVFADGVAPDVPEVRKTLIKENGIKKDTCSFYYLPGRYNPETVKKTDAVALKAMYGNMFNEMSNSVAETMMERFEDGYDEVKIENVQPIIDEVLAIREEALK